MLNEIGHWLSDNSSLLSGVAAVAALTGIVLSALGRGAKSVGSMLTRGKSPEPVLEARAPATDSNGSRGLPAQAGLSPLPATVAAGEPVLAVLPFDNLSSDPEMQYFSDGISEEILQCIARRSRLKVIGRLSSFQFRGERKADAARQLHCSHVLDGSIRRQADSVRINTQLVEAASQTTLWAESYDRGLDDIFAVQDDISQNIAHALDHAFARVDTQAVDPAVYDIYLRSSPKSYAPDELRTRVGLLEVVTQRAPDFGAAWSRLAYLRGWLHLYLPYGERAANARLVNEEATRAFAFDAESIDATVARLFVLPPYGCFAESDALIEQARRAPGAADGKRYMGWFLRNTGRVREALEDTESAYRLDSLDPMSVNLLALARMAAGKVAAAIPLYTELVERIPEMSFPISSLLRAYAFQADWAAVDRLLVRAAERQLREFEDGLAFIRAKRDPSAHNIATWRDAVAAQVRDTGCTDVSRLVYTAHLGLVDDAMKFAESAHLGPTGARSDILGPDAYRTALMFQTGMPELRNDPRFLRLCARLGLVEFWMTSGKWPDCVDEVPYDFRSECRKVRGIAQEKFGY